jgi:hypothetical protein
MAFPIASAKYPSGTGTAASPAYSGIFIPTIWSGKLIEKFYSTTVLAAISNTNYEGEIKKYGDHVVIRQKPTITIRSYQADQELTVDRPSSNVLDLYIDQADYFNTVLDDVMRIQADLNMMDLWAEDASEQMKIKIDTKVLAVFPTGVAAANKGATAGALSGNINLGAAAAPLSIVGRKAGAGQIDPVDLLVAMGQVLDEQNIPETGRWAVVPAWFRSLLMGSDIRQAYLTGDDTSPLRNGRVGVIDRFTIYASNLLPTGVETGGNATWIFAGHQNGLTFASQMTELESMRSERTFGTIMRGLQVYGYSMTDPTAVVAAYGRKTAVVGTGT